MEIIKRTTYVANKTELSKAIKQHAKSIEIGEMLAKKLNPVLSIMKMPNAKKLASITFLTGSGAVVVGSLMASYGTAGVSGGVGAVATLPAVVAFSAKEKVDILTVVGSLILCVSIGTSNILALLKDYNVEAKFGKIILKYNK